MPKTRFERDYHAGKTTTAQQVADASNLTAINIGELVSTQSLHDGYDDEFESWIINDDKVKDIHPLLSSAQSLEAGAWSDMEPCPEHSLLAQVGASSGWNMGDLNDSSCIICPQCDFSILSRPDRRMLKSTTVT